MITSTWIAPGDSLEAVQAIRSSVFIKELGISETVLNDGLDGLSWNLIMNLDGVPVGCGRLASVDSDTANISRVAVLPDYRKQGIGEGIVRVLLFKAANAGLSSVTTQVSEGLRSFAEKIGFLPDGEAYFKNGIAHYPMRKETADGCSEGCKDQ